MRLSPDLTIDVESAVHDRYTGAAREPETALCCPISYDPTLLAAIPREILDRDYGCGDPTKHLQPGETVLDLGSGSGKACFLAAQVVGPSGRVIGVDVTPEMLALARRNVAGFAATVGYRNVEFRRGRIQDLALDLDLLDRYLAASPVVSSDHLGRLEAEVARLRASSPLVADGSVDVVTSNCVLNLVKPADKRALFGEIFRVLRRGGRAVISDIVSDEDVPEALQADRELWSGCISGAFREDLFLEAFEQAGFHGITVVARQSQPWRTVQGIEFRSQTVVAWKGKQGPCFDRNQAIIYRGPFREVVDDDGHTLRRGVRTAVCDKTFRLYGQASYRQHFDLIEPRVPVPPEEAPPFPCAKGALRRDPRASKGADYRVTTEASAPACGTTESGDGSCC